MTRVRPAALARQVLLPPLVGGAAIACLLVALAVNVGPGAATASNVLTGGDAAELTRQLSIDIEGTPTAVDVQRARRPLSERQRLLASHPYFELYKIAKQRFGVPWYLVASAHYQETGFGRAPARLADRAAWRRFGGASEGMTRPADYPHRVAATGHPSTRDDFDVVMAIAAELKAAGATGLGAAAEHATAVRDGDDPSGRLSSAVVIERARAWKLLGTLPLPGSGELVMPVKGIVGGCGFFGCPRPGHVHNGVDFLAPTGTPVHAADGGTVAVLESTSNSSGYGNFICLQHRPHLATCYAHLSAVAETVTAGARIQRGGVIGLVGSTGSSSAPHLHFEVRRGDAECSTCAVDPMPLLDDVVPQATVPEMAALPEQVSAPVATTPVANGALPPSDVVEPQVAAVLPEPATTATAPTTTPASPASGSSYTPQCADRCAEDASRGTRARRPGCARRGHERWRHARGSGPAAATSGRCTRTRARPGAAADERRRRHGSAVAVPRSPRGEWVDVRSWQSALTRGESLVCVDRPRGSRQ